MPTTVNLTEEDSSIADELQELLDTSTRSETVRECLYKMKDLLIRKNLRKKYRSDNQIHDRELEDEIFDERIGEL